jgi:hypothetical protein
VASCPTLVQRRGCNILETARPAQQLICVRGKHPTDIEEVAEAYCMGRLALPEAIAFEDHYLTCAQCAAIVEAADLYVGAMREAARRLTGFVPKLEE